MRSENSNKLIFARSQERGIREAFMLGEKKSPRIFVSLFFKKFSKKKLTEELSRRV